jgi:hypothetical protein
MSNKFAKMAEKDPSKYPARMGQKWEETEINKLLALVQNKKSIHEMALEHERTEGSIRAQLRNLAYEFSFYEKRPIEQIMKFTGLTKDEIEDAIARRAAKVDTSSKKIKMTKSTKISDLSGDLKILADIIEKKKFIISQNMYSSSTPLAKVYDQEKVDILVPILKILKDMQDRLSVLEKNNE